MLSQTQSLLIPGIDYFAAVVVQSLSCVWLSVTLWTAAHQAPLLFTICSSLFKFMFTSQWCYLTISSSAALFPFPFNLWQHQGLFQWVDSSHQVARVLDLQLQHQSFQWIFRVDFLYDWLVWFPCSPRDSQESPPTPQFESINPLVLSLLYGPTLTICIWLLEKLQLWLDCPLSAKWSLCFLTCCLGLS